MDPSKKEFDTVFKNPEFKEKFIECVELTFNKEKVSVYLMKLTQSVHFDGLNRYFK